MHELAITQSMFDIVLKYAHEAGAKKVTKISVVIGEMTGVVAESVRFYLDLLGKNTVTEGVVVSITTAPSKAKCLGCEQTFEPKELDWTCPNCKEAGIEIVSGKELFIESIEVE